MLVCASAPDAYDSEEGGSKRSELGDTVQGFAATKMVAIEERERASVAAR